MTQAQDPHNTPLFAAVTDVRAELASVKAHPAAPALRFDGLDAAVDRLAVLAANQNGPDPLPDDQAGAELAEVEPAPATQPPAPTTEDPSAATPGRRTSPRG